MSGGLGDAPSVWAWRVLGAYREKVHRDAGVTEAWLEWWISLWPNPDLMAEHLISAIVEKGARGFWEMVNTPYEQLEAAASATQLGDGEALFRLMIDRGVLE